MKTKRDIMSHADRAERRKMIAMRVRGGASAAEASVEFGVTIDTVKSACVQHGVTLARFSALRAVRK
jgi:transposase-like protein